MEALKERGIGTGLHFRSCSHTKILSLGVLPRCRYRRPNGIANDLSLPLFPDNHDRHADHVITALQQLAGQ
ncbi:hypothetical protein ACNKHP_04350 [Shigella boydii]